MNSSTPDARPSRGRAPGRILSARLRTDDGFSLIEAIVAIGIVTGLILSLGAALASGTKATLLGRQNQTASDVATERLEAIRQMTYASAQMNTADLGGDPRIAGGKFDPGTGTPEPVFAGPSGSINPHVTTVSRNNTVYTVGSYITTTTDTTAATASEHYRRATVVVSWDHGGQTRLRTASTFLVNTTRGLPLPRFAIHPVGPQIRVQDVGDTPYWGFKVTNLGARDAWNIVASAQSWTYYYDTDGDGIHDASETGTIADYDLNGVPDTGAIEPTKTVSIVAVRNSPLTAAELASCGTTACRVTFVATSAAQPTAATASRSIYFDQKVSPGSVLPTPAPTGTATVSPTATASPDPAPVAASNGGTVRSYYPHNGTTAGTTSTQSVMPLDQSAPTNSTLYNYSTEGGPGFGRRLLAGGTDTGSDATRVADWRYQAPSAMTFSGTATVTVYVQCTANEPVTLRASIGSSTNTNLNGYAGGATGNATMTVCSKTSFTPLTIGVPLATTVDKNKYLTVRVYNPVPSGAPVRLLYDVTSHAAVVALPQVAP